MGRRTKTVYRLRQQAPGAPWSVRYRDADGVRQEYFTGERDRVTADAIARRVVGEALLGRQAPTARAAQSHNVTPEAIGKWLAAAPLRPLTKKRYETAYAFRWLREIPILTSETAAAYVRKRLGETRAKSVRSEVAALRGLASWLFEVGRAPEPIAVPSPPPGALGTPSTQKRRVRAPAYTPREVWNVINALPAKSRAGFWVRARCAFIYVTTLRPSTVDRLEVGRHWSPGEVELRITDDIDKEGAERDLPLSEIACNILEACAPDEGLIFGEHKYEHYTRTAARAVLPPVKAEAFTWQHLRSAGATHLLEAGAEITGLQYLMGHARVSTTAVYIRANKAAAARAVGRIPGRNQPAPRKSSGKSRSAARTRT